MICAKLGTIKVNCSMNSAERDTLIRKAETHTGQSQMKCMGSVTIQVIFLVLMKNWVHFWRLIVEVFIFW